MRLRKAYPENPRTLVLGSVNRRIADIFIFPDSVSLPQPDSVSLPQPDSVSLPQPDSVSLPQQGELLWRRN